MLATEEEDDDIDEDTTLSEKLLEKNLKQSLSFRRQRKESVDTEDLEDIQERELDRFINHQSASSKSNATARQGRKDGGSIRPGISYKKR